MGNTIKLNSTYYVKNNDNRIYNKRKEVRYPVRIFNEKFQTVYTFDLKNDWNQCELYDICLNGAGVRLSQLVYLNEIIYFKIITKTDYLVFKTKVVNINGIRIGVKFMDIDEEKISFLSRVIKDISGRAIIKSGIA